MPTAISSPTSCARDPPSESGGKGACGHTWKTGIANRVRGTGCPYCAGQVATPGVDDLATVRPDLAAEWHPRREGSATLESCTLQTARMN